MSLCALVPACVEAGTERILESMIGAADVLERKFDQHRICLLSVDLILAFPAVYYDGFSSTIRVRTPAVRDFRVVFRPYSSTSRSGIAGSQSPRCGTSSISISSHFVARFLGETYETNLPS